MLAIRPCSDFLAINAHKDQYFVLTEKQWTTCATIRESEFLCPQIQSKFTTNAEKCLCELSLLNNNSQKSCNIVPVTDNTSLTQLDYSNQWLYTMQQPSRINAVCGQEKSQLTLKGSGLLKISSDCTIKLNSIIIKGHQTVSTPLQTSYTAMSNISDISYPDELQITKFHNKIYADQIKNISDIQNKLHQRVSAELPSQIKHVKYHHGTIAYIALSLVIIICLKIAWKKAHCKRLNPNQHTPRPAVRQHIPTPEFEVSVV